VASPGNAVRAVLGEEVGTLVTASDLAR
jgi:hypothetical protein